MKKPIIIVAVVVAVLAAGGILFAMTNKAKAPTVVGTNTSGSAQTPVSTTPETQSTETTPPGTQETVITYSDSGYSPASITVKNGATVTIKNTSDHSMQFDSDPHPAHTTNTELNVEKVSAGNSQTFMVKKTGTFGYHNHLNPSETGTIIVQ